MRFFLIINEEDGAGCEKYGYKGVIMEGRDIGTTMFLMLVSLLLRADASTRGTPFEAGANDFVRIETL